MNKVIFNNKELNDYLTITYIDEPLLIPTDAITVERPIGAGVYFARKKVQPKEIKVGFELLSDAEAGRQALIDEMAAILHTEELTDLILRDERKYKAILIDSVDLDRLMHDRIGELLFFVPDGYGYSLIPTEVKNIHNKNLVNDGTAPSRGIIEVKFSSSKSSTKLTLNNGKYIYIEHAFVNGDTLEVDFENETVKKNGNLIMNDLHLESDFFSIPPGAFKITVTEGVADLTFVERWL